MGSSPDKQTSAPTPPGQGMGTGAPGARGGRFRSYALFVAAVFYYFIARGLAHRGADGLAGEAWSPLIEQAMLVFLLLVGYSAMGFVFHRQMHPVSAQGLPRREGWRHEFGMGLATGWGIAILCVIPMTLVGGIAVVVSGRAAEWGWLLADTAFFLLATLAEEIAFRGYGFQCFVEAIGPLGAALGFSLYFAVVQQLQPGSSRTSFAVSVALGLLLSTAYLRTRALWVSWGLNFGWKASRALLFGLTVCGVGSHSSVVEGDPMGPYWLTGGGFGLDGTWIACLILLAAIPVLVRITRDLDFRYNAPVIVPAGIPVDLDAAARRQHEAAMGSESAAGASPASLVQIAAAPLSSRPEASAGPPQPPNPPAV
ncbi:MAG: CPBP family intramembrane glutamic endopeptidase [Acidobacteriota bacterium]